MNSYKKYFPLTQRYTYLNTPASGLLSQPVLDWRKGHDLAFFKKGSLLKINEGELLMDVREKVGKLFHCAPNRIGFAPNFSYGFNTLLSQISNTHRVLLLEQDYPSIIWPFTSGGFKVSYVQVSRYMEEEVEAAFAKAQPRIFAFSIVQWLNGVKIDLTFIKHLKSKYSETLFIADATQYLGTEDFDFDASAIDVVGGSTYKWMNAGYGNAIFMFKPWLAQFFPNTKGFVPLQGEYKAHEGSLLGFFEPGHLDTLNFGSLGAAIDFINHLGMPTITKRIEVIALMAKRALTERNLLESTVVNRVQHSSIFNIKGDDAVFSHLIKKDILCIQRGEGIRVGFHYYHSREDLETLLNALDTMP